MIGKWSKIEDRFSSLMKYQECDIENDMDNLGLTVESEGTQVDESLEEIFYNYSVSVNISKHYDEITT